MRDLQAAISDAANRNGSRVSIGPGVTWGALDSVPGYLPSLVAQGDASAISFFATEVSPTGTPATKVAKSAAKPVGATVATSSKTIGKFSAMANLTLEDFEQSEAAIGAVVNVLAAQAAVALDQDAVAALDTAAAEATPAATWVAAISAGQAQVVAAGGRPGLVVVPAADWADLASEIASSSGLASPSSDAILSVLGSRVVISPKAPAGEAFVLDPSAALTVLRDVGVIVDAVSQADTNEIRVVVDLVAQMFVTRPSGVAAIAVTSV